ncbi:MAG: transposase, partial [Cyanobacteriota bacterium]
MRPSPVEWLPSDHLVFVLLDLPNELDFSAIMTPALARDLRGDKGFAPRMVTLSLLYSSCIGIVASRNIERACYEDLAFRVLTGIQQPDHCRISDVRLRNLEALSGLYRFAEACG